MSLNVMFAVLSPVAALGLFAGAFMARRKGDKEAFELRIVLGISMLLLALHNFYTLASSN